MGWDFLGQVGIVLGLGLAAFGSAVGIGRAGIAAAGAWAKQAKAGKPLDFKYIVLVGLPISQTLYAMIVMRKMGELMRTAPEIAVAHAGLLFGIGVAAGLGEMLSAWFQGLIGAAGCRALSEGEKGFPFILIAMGIVETVGIFTFVFLNGQVPKLPGT